MKKKFIHFLLVVTPAIISISICMILFFVKERLIGFSLISPINNVFISICYLFLFFVTFSIITNVYKPIKKTLTRWFLQILILGIFILYQLHGLMNVNAQ